MSRINHLVYIQLNEDIFPNYLKKVVAPIALIGAINHGSNNVFDHQNHAFNEPVQSIYQPVKITSPSKILADKLKAKKIRTEIKQSNQTNQTNQQFKNKGII